MRKWLILGTSSVLLTMAGTGYGAEEIDFGAAGGGLPRILPNNFPFSNETGLSSSFSTTGSVDRTTTFFQKLGSNNRTCETCHAPNDGWSLSVRSARAIFNATNGTAPLFEFDGHNCPTDDVSTVAARRSASSLMLSKALVRFAKTLPTQREFDIVAADGLRCATTNLNLNYFVYRRSLPTTNFKTIQHVLWDGAITFVEPNPQGALRMVANGAVFQHSERMGGEIAEEQKDAIVALGNSLSNAQVLDLYSRNLDAQGGLGGAINLSRQPITGPKGFTLFNAWSGLTGNDPTTQARRSVARGQAIFNTKTFAGGQTCASCHSSPNLGNAATNVLIDTGVSNAVNRTPDLPLYTVKNRTTGQIVKVTDLGRAGVSGKWADMSKFKPPMLRSLAARAPYFHNGLAPTLEDVVRFYQTRFNIYLTQQEARDLANFLKAL